MNQFTRSNVAESTLQISQPDRSSFDLYHRSHVSLPIGKFIPVMVQSMMPNSVLSGVVNPEFTLEPVGTPQIGPLRQDIHTFAVNASRINRDWIRFINKEDGFDFIPSFNSASLFGHIFGVLLDSDASFLDGCKSGSDPNKWHLHNLYTRVIETYRGLYRDTSAVGDFGYNRDWYYVEYVRLKRLLDLLPDYYVEWPEFCDGIYEIMKPWFGEGSTMDNLRYPTYTYYCSAFNSLKYVGLPTSTFSDIGLGGLFRIAPGGESELIDLSLYECNEMMLRASYCAWFDCLRNWHVEDKNNVPNVNNWDSLSIFKFQTRTVAQWQSIQYITCLLIPRYRTFGSDAFTTIQTDDIFRHVFNPIFINDPIADGAVASSDPSTVNNNVMNNIYSVLVNGLSQVFPQGLFRRLLGTQTTYDICMNDLHSMRRSGWLENYLARDYFFPDTFIGQMAAHWHAKPVDILIFSANYLGGSESFISGDQLIASTNGNDGVTGTPAGTRTFAGGASSSGSILHGSNGDFAYVVTFASLQPIPTYDSKDMHLVELNYSDLPFTEFALDTRVQIAARDMIRGIESNGSLIGYVPRNYAWRTSLDSVHGKFLREYRSLIWLRDWWSAASSSVYFGGSPTDPLGGSPFTITAYGLHVHVVQDAFNAAFHPEDHVAYGTVTFNYSCQCPLPAAVEKI